MIRVIMVEDDHEIAQMLQSYLKDYGIEVYAFNTPNSALENLKIDHYDLAILDLTLPEMDGLELCKRIRKDHDFPIVISTARRDLTDKVLGFDYGADDYLPKPYEPRELVARIQSIMRRYRHATSEESKRFRLDEEQMRIFKNGEPLNLTLAEYEILKLFILRQNTVISREYIANNVNAIAWESTDNSINVLIGRIRKKVEQDPKHPEFIKSIRGVGYTFVQ